jgi:hypothetical protein
MTLELIRAFGRWPTAATIALVRSSVCDGLKVSISCKANPYNIAYLNYSCFTTVSLLLEPWKDLCASPCFVVEKVLFFS